MCLYLSTKFCRCKCRCVVGLLNRNSPKLRDRIRSTNIGGFSSDVPRALTFRVWCCATSRAGASRSSFNSFISFISFSPPPSVDLIFPYEEKTPVHQSMICTNATFQHGTKITCARTLEGSSFTWLPSRFSFLAKLPQCGPGPGG